MNKKELIKELKKTLNENSFFNLELHKKKVFFTLYNFNRQVGKVEIPYKNNTEKSKIYEAILYLLNNFDFSFEVYFSEVEKIYSFINIEEDKP